LTSFFLTLLKIFYENLLLLKFSNLTSPFRNDLNKVLVLICQDVTFRKYLIFFQF